MYRLRKTFAFTTPAQREAFLEIAGLYGEVTRFGDTVILQAGLEFFLWRKLIILARMLAREEMPDIRSLSTRAGLRMFRKAGLH